ncbi:hypothetical protein [Brucella sp. IR073]|uniref:hypothetical protein n=1 Tax=unclassified Brucella TaxID=2632610 RepID=UPI003B985476
MEQTFMKAGIALSVSLVLLSGCSTSSSNKDVQTPAKAVSAAYAGIETFRNVCLATAPSFDGAIAAAKQRGIVKYLPLGKAQIGSNADNSVSVQVEPNHECAVTTPNYTGDGTALRAEFIEAVSKSAGAPVSGTNVPFTAQIKGAKFIFMHDRRGGEAFVALRAK